jgi:hypothetical protein
VPQCAQRTYLVETYAGRGSAAQIKAAVERAAAAAAALTASGRTIRHVRSILLRDDETCFHLFTADEPSHVTQVLKRAGIEYDRILEAELITSRVCA